MKTNFNRFVLFISILSGITFILIPWYFVNVGNADLYGRLTETINMNQSRTQNNSNSDLPTIRLVLHKCVVDENLIEASLLIYTSGEKIEDSLKKGKISLTATISDGYIYNPIGIEHSVTLNNTSLKKYNRRINQFAVESDRFFLPAAPSLTGYPFDDNLIHPMVYLMINGQNTFNYNFEIQKALPGRLIEVVSKDQIIIKLTRTTTEKTLVIVSSIIFLILTILLGYKIIRKKNGLSTLEELVTITSYILATVGIRELLGLSRNTGTSALEITVIGLPLILLFICLVISFFRGHSH